jgi:hypothetical protein
MILEAILGTSCSRKVRLDTWYKILMRSTGATMDLATIPATPPANKLRISLGSVIMYACVDWRCNDVEYIFGLDNGCGGGGSNGFELAYESFATKVPVALSDPEAVVTGAVTCIVALEAVMMIGMEWDEEDNNESDLSVQLPEYSTQDKD